jgi:hypothetical protein
MIPLLVEAEQKSSATAPSKSGLPGGSNNPVLLLINTKLSRDDGKDGFIVRFGHLIIFNVVIQEKL